MRKKGRGNRERERDTRRAEEVRRTPSSRTRPETTIRMDMPQSSSGTQVPTTPVGPQPQRWTAVPALIQPYPQQHQQRTPVARDNSSRAGGSRVPFVPPTTRMQAQPTIILLPQVGGGARVPPPGQAAVAAHPSFHPVNWRYPQGREQQRLVERGGTRRSRR